MKTIFLILCCFFFQRICAQIMPSASDSGEIVCYFDPIRFDVQYSNAAISFPDSLNDGSIDKLMVKIFINKAAKVDSFTVIKVLIGQDKKTIDYLGKLPEDEQTRRCYPFVREFLKKKLLIKKLSEPTEQYTIMILPIKFVYPHHRKKSRQPDNK